MTPDYRPSMIRSLPDNKLTRALGAAQEYWQLATYLWSLFEKGRERRERATTWHLSVRSTDQLYEVAHAWALSQIPAEDARNLVAVSATREGSDRDREDDEVSAVGAPGRRSRGADYVQVRADTIMSAWTTVGGHRVKVTTESYAGDRGETGGGDGRYAYVIRSVKFTYHSPAALPEIRGLLHDLYAAEQAKNRPPQIRTLAGWGWTRGVLPPRHPDSVVLKTGQWGQLNDDIQRFFDSEHEYVRRSLPYHRGYLFYGPPGTGKTSLASAMAHAHGLDLYSLPLSEIESDGQFINALQYVKPGSVLLLEDIDTLGVATTRDSDDDDEGGPSRRSRQMARARGLSQDAAARPLTLSGLLNGLDGLTTPRGVIFVLTTNHPDRIDPALLRPGRVDLRLELGYADDAQATDLFTWWYERPPATPIRLSGQWTCAALTEVFKTHMNDPVAAERALAGGAVLEAVA